MENKIKRITIKNDVIRIWRYPSKMHEYNKKSITEYSYNRLLVVLQNMRLVDIDHMNIMYVPKGF